MIKVILVDDHRILRDGLKQLIESEKDMEVVGVADNGRDGVKLALEKSPDVVIMDMAMRELNGMEATRQILHDNKQIKVIALTSHAEKPIVLRALKTGMSGYILKDSASAELISATRKVYSGRKYLCQMISTIVIDEISEINEPTEKNEAFPLSSREGEILQLLTEGNNVHEVGSKLFISSKTVESHRANIMEKLNIHALSELTKYALRTGITSLEN
jgi:DNA-binding NarL/FixJ family response regulator